MAERRCVVVTGAGQGLGRAVAEAFAAQGDAVVVSDIAAGLAIETVRSITRSGGTATAQPADVSSEADMSALAAKAAEEFGTPRVWVNNAGVSRPAMLHKMAADDFDFVLRVHARGTFLGIREAAQAMMAGGAGGVIVNVTSSAGLQGTIGQINYAGAKGAIIAMTKSAARELARYDIRVNAVAPLAATPMTEKLRTDEKLSRRFLDQIPLRRFGTPEEAASAFVYLAAEQSAYITGQVLSIDGGLYMVS
ncbi:SDR family NAD(P)-dependent oxidoreductase [Acrocarpospora catenulata]|uniref:SDR family NAD(P)-dependent oxidoreductase n=1 Tax=Acrocarpospora catenulata TaxID=2836182 RepID=UPI001BD97E1C|nr:glucose 1-dehydrogenase [Acrocarpospora catenulata]